MSSTLSKSLILDGVGASEAIDTSGEVLSIDGLDISELEEGRGVLNWDHRSSQSPGGSANDLIGAITYAKKIFTEKDCKTDRERMYWTQVQLPFLYIQAELFDSDGHPGAIAAASLIRYYNRRKLPILVRFSIEGSVLERDPKDNNRLNTCIARAVAATVKPCNRTCFSGVLSDSDDPQEVDPLESLARTEHPSKRILGSYQLEINPVVSDPVDSLKDSLENLKEAAALSKAMSAGSYNAAPTSLTGGAALQVEDVGKRKTLKAEGLAALRDWDRKSPFRQFLKHRLKDASESFINHFVNLVDEFHLKKQEELEINLRNALSRTTVPQQALDRIEALTKAAQPEAPPALAQLNSEPAEGVHKFGNLHVSPGEVELISGPYTGSKLHLLGRDDKYTYVKAHQPNPDAAIQVSKLPRSHEGLAYRVNRTERSVPKPLHVHADQHGIPELYRSMDQKHLVHGLNLNQRVEHLHPEDPTLAGVTKLARPEATGWFQSANGKVGYVKPEMPELFSRFQDSDAQKKLPIPARESIYHNLAHDFFGLGAHVPTTATFKHPKTGEQMSVMEAIPGARHFEDGDDDNEYAVHQAGESGALDKLHIMDTVLGHTDRPLNWMVTDQAPNVHHIDNGYIFNYRDPVGMPGYLNYYQSNHPDPSVSGQRPENTQIHPEAARWLMGLDPEQLGQHLQRMNVPHGFISNAQSRLHDLKTRAWSGPVSRGDVVGVGGKA